MNAEVITIGDELLIGQVVDTNSAWIGRELNNVGVEVLRITSVRDRYLEITQAIEEAILRADLILLTGGLGPTKDDITKQVLCDYFQTKLVFNNKVFENIKRILGQKMSMNSLNQSQAMVPESCIVINNRVGTAAVSWFEQNGKILISMPGVPQEMKIVMSEEILPRLKHQSIEGVILHKSFWIKNYPESVLAEKLEKWESCLPDSIKLAYLPSLGIVRLRLTARGRDEKQLRLLLDSQTLSLKEILGKDVFEEYYDSLEQMVGEKMRKSKLTISTAESCTGGTVAARLTSISGSSEYFKGGIVAYSNDMKIKFLDVSNEIIDNFGAVSEETVKAMAKGAMLNIGTDCAIATSGIAGPNGGTENKPVGTVWIAVAYKDEVRTLKQEIDRGRLMNIERAVNNAFLLLLELM